MFELREFSLGPLPRTAFGLAPSDGFAPLLLALALVLIAQREAPARMYLFLALPFLLGFFAGLDTRVDPAVIGSAENAPAQVALIGSGFLGLSGVLLLVGAALLAVQHMLHALFYPRLVHLLALPVTLLPAAWTLQAWAIRTGAVPQDGTAGIGAALSLAAVFAVTAFLAQLLISLLRRAGGGLA